MISTPCQMLLVWKVKEVETGGACDVSERKNKRVEGGGEKV